MDSLYGPFVLRGRTNLCSVTGKTGEGRESRWAGRARECARRPRLAAFSIRVRSSHVIPALACALAGIYGCVMLEYLCETKGKL
jgi:hypothetical protein